MFENIAANIPLDISGLKSEPTENTLPPQGAFFAFNLVGEKLRDAQTPAYLAEFDPVEAEEAGAFYENALSETDALDSVHDFTPFVPLAASLKT